MAFILETIQINYIQMSYLNMILFIILNKAALVP